MNIELYLIYKYINIYIIYNIYMMYINKQKRKSQ